MTTPIFDALCEEFARRAAKDEQTSTEPPDAPHETDAAADHEEPQA